MRRARLARGTTSAILAILDRVVTATFRTARDIETGQAEGVRHVGAMAPGGSRTASYGVALALQPISAYGFQTVIHGAMAVDEGSLCGGAFMGAVALTAITLDSIWWQILKFQDWPPVAFGCVTALQEVESVVVVKASGTWAARKVATAPRVLLIPCVSFQAPVGHHLDTLLSRVAALQALLPSPLAAHVG